MKRYIKFKKWIYLAIVFGALFVILILVISILGAVSGAVGGSGSNCDTSDTTTSETSTQAVTSDTSSVDKFVKDHEDAYIKSWKAGGFLPSASITQTMIEVSFSSSVPSFGQAHNMGGVKWSSASDYPQTIKFYGSDAISATGLGTSVGDATGGSYAYFKDFDAGIVGKAEFMSNQTLYVKAINNTDGKSTLDAIADGGWATDPSYKTKLESMYESLGSKYKWLDEKAIKEYGEKPVKNPGTSSGDTPNTEESDSSDDVSNEVDFSGAEQWYEDRIGKVHYSMSSRTGPTSYDCSSSLYYALTANGAQKTNGDTPVSTETEHDWLKENGYEKIYEGKWSSDKEMDDLQEGDVFIWGTKGDSSGGGGHTGLFIDDKQIIHCSSSNDGIQKNDYKKCKHDASNHGTVYIYRLTNSSSSVHENCSNDDSDSTSGDSADGSGTVPNDATAWGYKPADLPSSLKPYVHNPEDLGLKYGGPDNWQEHTGQCVALTESFGNLIWGHQGIVIGDGGQQAQAWASTVFHNKVKDKPKAGAIFSTPTGSAGVGHTGIVSHVFEDGSILIVEQNSTLSGANYGKNDTWNYRIVTKKYQEENQYTFAYPDGQEPKWSKQ